MTRFAVEGALFQLSSVRQSRTVAPAASHQSVARMRHPATPAPPSAALPAGCRWIQTLPVACDGWKANPQGVNDAAAALGFSIKEIIPKFCQRVSPPLQACNPCLRGTTAVPNAGVESWRLRHHPHASRCRPQMLSAMMRPRAACPRRRPARVRQSRRRVPAVIFCIAGLNLSSYSTDIGKQKVRSHPAEWGV